MEIGWGWRWKTWKTVWWVEVPPSLVMHNVTSAYYSIQGREDGTPRMLLLSVMFVLFCFEFVCCLIFTLFAPCWGLSGILGGSLLYITGQTFDVNLSKTTAAWLPICGGRWTAEDQIFHRTDLSVRMLWRGRIFRVPTGSPRSNYLPGFRWTFYSCACVSLRIPGHLSSKVAVDPVRSRTEEHSGWA